SYNGAGWTRGENLTTSGRPDRLISGFVSDDDYADLIVASSAGVTLFTADNAASLEKEELYPMGLPTSISGAALIDLDLDGDLDVVVAAADQTGTSRIRARRNVGGAFFLPGTGLFGDPAEDYSELVLFDQEVSKLHVTDLNQDHAPDLVLAGGGEDRATVLFGPFTFSEVSGEERFQEAARLTVPLGRNVRDVKSADINGDGSIDLVSANLDAPLDYENERVLEPLTVWLAPTPSAWREQLSLRGTAPGPVPIDGASTISLPNIPRYVESAVLSLSLIGDPGTNFNLTVTSPEGRPYAFNNQQLFDKRSVHRFALPLVSKWQRGQSWEIEVSGPVTVENHRLALKSSFTRPSYESIECDASLEGQPRLVEGRLEVCASNQWGTVCDDLFGAEEVSVVCRQLGFADGALISVDRIEDGSGSIHLDDLACVGDEVSLLACPGVVVGVNDCGHDQDVGIRCF
ncbi:MAG: FG-GAP-like repeat-containing protein, partial [Myxococcota bacterium]|nr:FG-GAP-like repeat-containing protein [Myxococcota bacterium]